MSSPARVAAFVLESGVRFHAQKDRVQYAQWLRRTLIDLGPTWVKFGQFLSTRPDLVEGSIVTQMQSLQDNVTPIPTRVVTDIVKRELKIARLEDVFASFEEECIASASIGQVHGATLKDGRRVVVKVKKPRVAESFKQDLAIVKAFNEVTSFVQRERAADVNHFLKLYEMQIQSELDYAREAKHMLEFDKHKSEFPVRVKVPKPIMELCVGDVLVMSNVASIKATDVDELKRRGIDAAWLANSLTDVFLHQIMNLGLVHCDPHPGNIGVCTTDNNAIVLYDFGNVIRLSTDFRKRLAELIFSIYQQDVDEFVTILTELRILKIEDPEDRTRIKVFFGSFFEYLKNVDMARLRRDVVRNSASSPSRVALQIDPNFTALFRVFTLLDGTCTTLDPNFNYIDSLLPYIMQNMDLSFFDTRAKRDMMKLRDMSMAMQKNENSIVQTKDKISNLDNRLNWITALAGSVLLTSITHLIF